MTRKQMRAADPTTGVLPVVSVFARKPAAAAAPAPVPAGSPSTDVPAVPLAPAGHISQGIETGAAVPQSRRARRAATAGAGAGVGGTGNGAGTVSAGVTVPAAVEAPASADTGSASSADTSPASDNPASDSSQTSDSPTDSPAGDSPADEPVESRWTRTFGPPETGQLPVQRYLAAASAVETGGTSAERQQRSHSSL